MVGFPRREFHPAQFYFPYSRTARIHARQGHDAFSGAGAVWDNHSTCGTRNVGG